MNSSIKKLQLLFNTVKQRHADPAMNRTKPESNRSEEQKLLFGTAPYINPIAACYSRCIRLRVAFFFEGICGEAFEQGWVCHALVQNRVTAVTAVYFGLTASLILSQGLQIAPF